MKKKQNKKSFDKEVIYGANAIIEMLRAKKRKLYSIYTTKVLPKSWMRIKPYLPPKIQNIQYVSRDLLTKLAGSSEHMGLVALVSPFRFHIKIFDPVKKPFILLLDGVQDVRNLGAILRSAYCTGVDGVILCHKRGAALTSDVFKTSAGLAEHLDIHIAPSISRAVQDLTKSGYHFYMSVVRNGKNAAQISYKRPACLVIGSEATGITSNIRDKGELITLPQRSKNISYNA